MSPHWPVPIGSPRQEVFAQSATPTAPSITAYPLVLPVAILFLGFLMRTYLAWSIYLNADEVQIYFISAQKSLAATYKAGFLSAHPPLLYCLLHYWRWLGNGELALRLPSVLAGTGFCGLAYKWLGRIADETTALVGLIFFCFTPALVSLGAEVRHYSLLLFFIAACLYLLECALQENSALPMLLFSVSLWLAILTDYSAWVFSLTAGIYALMRFWRHPLAKRVIAVWASGQVIALAIYGVLAKTQLRWLLRVAEVNRIFQGEENQLRSLPRETFRLFHYLFSQPVAGGVVLLLFMLGIVHLFHGPRADGSTKPSNYHLACLLLMPFIFCWGAALAHRYLFEGSRHSIVLAVFVIAGASLGVAGYGRPGSWIKPLLVAGLLAACYAFAAPLGPYIKPDNQNRQRMALAVNSVRQAASPGTIFLVDDQSSYLFRYYFCRTEGMSVIEVPAQSHLYTCGEYRLARSSQWMFTAGQMGADLQRTVRTYGLGPGETVWFFQAGWNVNKEPALQAKLRDFGCAAPLRFGDNILTCPLKP